MRRLSVVALLVVCSLLTIEAIGAAPAAAAQSPQYAYSNVAQGFIDTRTMGGAVNDGASALQEWMRCDYSGYWRVPLAGGSPVAVVTMSCGNGLAVDIGPFNSDDNVALSGASCSNGVVNADDIGQSEEHQVPHSSSGTIDFTDYDQSCGPVTDMCFSFKLIPVGALHYRGCNTFPLGAPPAVDGAAVAYQASGQAGCAAFTALEPWVTTPTPVAVTGGWVWQSQVTLGIQWASKPPTAQMGGYTVNPYGYVLTMGAVTTYEPSGDQYAWLWGSGHPAAAETTTFRDQVAPQAYQDVRSLKVDGPVHTGALGSVPLDWQYRAVGEYWYANDSVGLTPSTSGYPATLPTDAQLGSGSTLRMVGVNLPSKCLFAWGGAAVASYDTSHPPLPYQSAATPPSGQVCDPATCSTTEPTIVVNENGQCDNVAAGAICQQTPATDGSDNSGGVPGADSATGKCKFVADDPSTWTTGALCQLVQLGEKTTTLLSEIADELQNQASSVVVPPSDPSNPDSIDYNWRAIVALFSASALHDWITTATSSMKVNASAGDCKGPKLDLSSLHVPTFTSAYPFDACSGPTATAAGDAHQVLLVGVYVSGVWISARLVLWSFGISLPSLGGGSDDGDGKR
ncbi:MAG: hypothetical protein FWE71_01855 [Nocardioidaceae bacterium]|nr:hypothetical protein [Nocardioidaceae bacterium]MCL2613843.1 hypothetical protein [Nocardioidaceae bacterium]